MSQERILKALTGLGLSEIEARIYVYLEKNGPKSRSAIIDTLELSEEELQKGLRSLQSNDIVKTSARYCTKFFAEPFEKVIDSLIRKEREQNKVLNEKRAELISSWQSVIEKNS